MSRWGEASASRRLLLSTAGLLLLLGLWQLGAMLVHEIVIAPPLDAFAALAKMMGTARFWQTSWLTAQRALAGIGLGFTAGFSLGLIAGFNRDLRDILEPLRWMVMSISPVIVVVLAMLWFGMGTPMVVFIAAVLLAPIVYVNTVKGLEMVNEQLVEMADVYRLRWLQKLRHVYIPALAGPLAAAMTIVVTMGMRMIVLAELLGANAGIGHEISFARTDLDTPALFAWVVVTLALVGIAEYLVFKPLEGYLLRWRP